MGPREVTVAELERWTDSGAHWQALHVADDHALVELRACTGEPVERRAATDRGVIDYIRAASPERP
jgi:hypothetical protein